MEEIIKEVEASSTTITDPLLEPFFISRDNYCFTVYENVQPIEITGKPYLRAIGHYNNVGSCLESIIKQKMHNKKTYVSLREYIDEYKKITGEFRATFNELKT